jgi:hypothetical protein
MDFIVHGAKCMVSQLGAGINHHALIERQFLSAVRYAAQVFAHA